MSQKITQANWAGSMAQVVEHLPTKCEALSLNPITAKKSEYQISKNKTIQNKNKTKKLKYNTSH
jgi:hypothetical protein